MSIVVESRNRTIRDFYDEKRKVRELFPLKISPPSKILYPNPDYDSAANILSSASSPNYTKEVDPALIYEDTRARASKARGLKRENPHTRLEVRYGHFEIISNETGEIIDPVELAGYVVGLTRSLRRDYDLRRTHFRAPVDDEAFEYLMAGTSLEQVPGDNTREFLFPGKSEAELNEIEQKAVLSKRRLNREEWRSGILMGTNRLGLKIDTAFFEDPFVLNGIRRQLGYPTDFRNVKFPEGKLLKDRRAYDNAWRKIRLGEKLCLMGFEAKVKRSKISQ